MTTTLCEALRRRVALKRANVAFRNNAIFKKGITRRQLRRDTVQGLERKPLFDLFRAASGTPAALLDRCAHRFAPLSQGKVEGEHLECAYHGLRFNGGGHCVHNPHGATPKEARVQSFPVMERYGILWLWAGESQPPQTTDPPEFPFLEDPQLYAVVVGHLRVAANYQLITDNLLDLSYAQFLHPRFQTEGSDAAGTH